MNYCNIVEANYMFYCSLNKFNENKKKYNKFDININVNFSNILNNTLSLYIKTKSKNNFKKYSKSSSLFNKSNNNEELRKQYCSNLFKIANISKLSELKEIFSIINEPENLKSDNNYNILIFKSEFVPLWEENIDSGLISVYLNKYDINYIWINLIYKLMIFEDSKISSLLKVIGLICKFKNNNYIIEIWINNFDNSNIDNYLKLISSICNTNIKYLSAFKFTSLK